MDCTYIISLLVNLYALGGEGIPIEWIGNIWTRNKIS